MLWLRCDDCTHIFTDGYFTPEAAAIIFSKTHPHQQAGYDAEAQRAVSARMVEKLLPYAKDGDWLDIGFGNASLLFTAQEYGFGVVGIDLRSDNVAALAQFGIESHCVNIADFNQTGRFSVISMADVLEHMPYPNNGLKEVHRLLKPGGLLFLSMPNKDCMPWEILDAQQANPYWGEIEHYHNFGRKRLYKLLEDQGFEPVRYGISERYRVCMEVIARKL